MGHSLPSAPHWLVQDHTEYTAGMQRPGSTGLGSGLRGLLAPAEQLLDDFAGLGAPLLLVVGHSPRLLQA